MDWRQKLHRDTHRVKLCYYFFGAAVGQLALAVRPVQVVLVNLVALVLAHLALAHLALAHLALAHLVQVVHLHRQVALVHLVLPVDCSVTVLHSLLYRLLHLEAVLDTNLLA